MNVSTQKNDYAGVKKEGVLEKLFGAARIKERAQACPSRGEVSELLDCIREAKDEWLEARINFEYAAEEELVDYYIYKIKACEVRYEYYLKKAKKIGLKVGAVEKLGTVLQEALTNTVH